MDAAVSKILPYQSLDKRLAKNNQGKGHIVIDQVSIRFHARHGVNTAVADANLNIKPGEFVCLLGPSGCGKSTLLNSVAGFVKPSEGSVTLDNKAVIKPGPDRGMVFQQHSLFPWKTVLDNVAFGPLMAGSTRSQAEGVARTFLEVVGLSGYAKQYPAMLSGGMLQRVGIARALANYPSVLLMDEPFGALDAQTRSLMQENLLEIWKEFKNTVLFVTHDIEEAVYLADRVVVMSASPGRLIADIKVNLPRPRPTDVFMDPHFIEVKAQCLQLIREETTRAFEQQNKTA
ncbi:ABC transporter ATP-binding protein [Ketobacter sp. MCCC 1A13808]|uniref:ABC transporter ATP-binding protein n=1 Tax=Ketobacter sp. MCCC 1A13808 TaxID=2602738 RepID=UPI0012EC01D7|nr:ABC transporter ATP-binding protein [Ketobacter sp. MCCC 1A13808]MVF14296.1 ABC transporter ATP-binding protein [Ketobacter sp. MCCC 1A13808]